MKRNRCLLMVIPVIAVAFCISTSYAWLVDKPDGKKAQVTAANIETELEFELNTNYGIPGEVINITAQNSGAPDTLTNVNTLTNMGSADYIFKITYTVSYDPENRDDGAVPYIFDLILDGVEKDRNDGNVLIGGSYSKETGALVCYGRHSGQDPMELGALHAEFDVMKKTAMSKPFTIEAEVIACQVTEKAVKDIFGISASDAKYAALFQTTP